MVIIMSLDYIEFVCEQIQNVGHVRFRKMFGEYMIYINDKPVLLVCQSTVFVKMLPHVEHLMKGSDVGIPYPGAKEHYILDIENTELSQNVATILEQITKIQKKRAKKTTK